MGDHKPERYGMLEPGRWYRVVQEFRDYDHFVHVVGETWVYLNHNFLPYDDGLSLFVSLDGMQEWHIRMQLREDEQEAIMRNFGSYVQLMP